MKETPPITRIAILNELSMPILVVIKYQKDRQRFHATLYPDTVENALLPGVQKILSGYNTVFPCGPHTGLKIRNKLRNDFDIETSDITFTSGEDAGHRTQCFFLIPILN